MYTVIIPSLGRINYLNELLTSIAAQTVNPSEVLILLDNNDHCRSIESQLELREYVKIIFCDSLNLAQKRNFGASIAKSNNILYSDDDDIWNNQKAQIVCAALEKSLVCTHNYGKFGSIVSYNCSKLGVKSRNLDRFSLLMGSNIFGGGSSISTKKFVIQTHPFSADFRYCEDFEWWVRVLLSGIDIRYIGDELVKYRTHDSNMTSSMLNINKYNLKLCRRLFSNGAILVTAAFVVAIRTIGKLINSHIR